MFYKDRLTLVTGGSGFIGTHIVKALLAQGARVRVPIHTRPMEIDDERVETISADLTLEQDCLDVMEGVDFVFHAAGAVGSADTKSDRAMAAITDNLILTSRVLQGAARAGVKRAQIFSSSTVYPVVDHPIKEEECWLGDVHPAYLGYGWMRRYIERISEYVDQISDLKIALVRPTAVYGPYDNFDLATCHVIPALIRKAVEKMTPYEVWGDGSEIRDFMHAEDLATGCLLMLEKGANAEPVNIAQGNTITIGEAVKVILQAAGHGDVKVAFDASMPTTIPVRKVDTSKARSLLGFIPKFSIEAGLKDTVEWYMAQEAGRMS